MLREAQHGQGRSKRGYTLIEVTAAVAIIVMVLLIVMGGYKTRINKARLEQTVGEMMSLAQASLDFYNSQGNWPIAPSNLAPTLVFVDPFGFKIRMETLERIMRIEKSEILLNFMFTRVNQFLSSPKIENTCSELFGCDDWKKCVSLNGSEREKCILESLRDRMKKFSKYVYYYKFEFANKKKVSSLQERCGIR